MNLIHLRFIFLTNFFVNTNLTSWCYHRQTGWKCLLEAEKIKLDSTIPVDIVIFWLKVAKKSYLKCTWFMSSPEKLRSFLIQQTNAVTDTLLRVESMTQFLKLFPGLTPPLHDSKTVFLQRARFTKKLLGAGQRFTVKTFKNS